MSLVSYETVSNETIEGFQTQYLIAYCEEHAVAQLIYNSCVWILTILDDDETFIYQDLKSALDEVEKRWYDATSDSS